MNISSVDLCPGQKPHWASFSFGTNISWHPLLRHITYTFPVRLRRDIPIKLVHSLLSPFACMGLITPFCQYFDACGGFVGIVVTVVSPNIKQPDIH